MADRYADVLGVNANDPAPPDAVVAPKVDPYAAALGISGDKPTEPVRAAAPTPEFMKTPAQRASEGMQAAKTQALGAERDFPAQMRAILANQLTGLGSSIVGGWKGLGTLVSGGSMDDAANVTRDYIERHTYAPDPSTPEGQAIASFGSSSNPINYPNVAIDKTADFVADRTGAAGPVLGTAIRTGGNLGLLLLGTRGHPSMATDAGPTPPTGVYQPIRLPQNQTLPALTHQEPVTLPQNVPSGAPGAPAAQPGSQQGPAPIPRDPAAVQAVAEKAPAALFPETPTVAQGGKFTPEQQAQRGAVLQEVGIDPSRVRRSAITGDHLAASTDWETAKVDNSAGRYMRDVIDQERGALTGYAEKLVNETGGTLNKDQTTLLNRGDTILAPLTDLKTWFDDKARTLYKAADERAQGQPTKLDRFQNLITDASEATNSDRINLQSGTQALLKKLGMVGDDGTISGTVQQAETVRKYLNEHASPANSRLISKLKEELDADVTSSAGADIYAEARQLWAQRKNTLDNPNGIAKIMHSEGPDGVNRSVPVEQVPSKLVSQPVAQFQHIVNTLKEAPEPIQGSATAALNEIKAQFANEINEVGNKYKTQWNAKGVTEYLRNNAAKMSMVFTPEELAKFRTLSDAGQILDKPTGYPGAAAQGHNIVQAGVVNSLPGAAATAGGFIAGPAGAGVGGLAGQFMAKKLGEAALTKNAQSRTMKLSDLPGTAKP